MYTEIHMRTKLIADFGLEEEILSLVSGIHVCKNCDEPVDVINMRALRDWLTDVAQCRCLCYVHTPVN